MAPRLHEHSVHIAHPCAAEYAGSCRHVLRQGTMLGGIQHENPPCTSKRTLTEMHTPTCALRGIITPAASGEQRTHVPPQNPLRAVSQLISSLHMNVFACFAINFTLTCASGCGAPLRAPCGWGFEILERKQAGGNSPPVLTTHTHHNHPSLNTAASHTALCCVSLCCVTDRREWSLP